MVKDLMMKIEVIKSQEATQIVNDLYPFGVSHTGANKFPDIGVPYEYIMYDTSAYVYNYYVDDNNKAIEFTQPMLDILAGVCSNWTQDLGQQGNPNDEQKIELIKIAVQSSLDADAFAQGFDNINSIAKFVGFTNRYEVMANNLARQAANTWEYVEDEFVKMQANQRAIPTPEEAIAEIKAQGF